LLALRFSAYLGVGRVTSFSYAYLAASTLVGATAFSLGLISSAPLTRRGIDAEAAARHVIYAAWVSLVIVGAAAGVFALVGGRPRDPRHSGRPDGDALAADAAPGGGGPRAARAGRRRRDGVRVRGAVAGALPARGGGARLPRVRAHRAGASTARAQRCLDLR